MSFSKNSALVKNVWVPLVLSGVYEYNQVPGLFNLRETVKEVLVELGAMEE